MAQAAEVIVGQPNAAARIRRGVVVGPFLAFGGFAVLVASMVLVDVTGAGGWFVLLLPGALVTWFGSRYWVVMKAAGRLSGARSPRP